MKNYLINRYCTIGEMSNFLKVSKHTILHYEELKLISPIRRGKNNYRYYSGKQIERFKHILYLRELGFSIKDIKECLDNKDKIKDLTKIQLINIEQELGILLEKKKELERFNSQIDLIEKASEKIGLPFLQEMNEVEAVYIEQESFSLESSVKSFEHFDSILDEVTWSEKYYFGLLIGKDNFKKNKHYPEKFVVQKNIENYSKKYTFSKGTYAVMYISSQSDENIYMSKLLDWIFKNKYVVEGDLFIQFSSSLSFFQKDDDSKEIKELKILVKKA